jgi:hypothetical protein
VFEVSHVDGDVTEVTRVALGEHAAAEMRRCALEAATSVRNSARQRCASALDSLATRAKGMRVALTVTYEWCRSPGDGSASLDGGGGAEVITRPDLAIYWCVLTWAHP